jgi:UDP-N-acetylmuramyl pentapeptide synthase
VELFSKHHRSVVLFEDLVSLRLHLKSLAQEGDVVLIKGSNSLQLWKVLED